MTNEKDETNLVEDWHLLLDVPRVVGPRGDVEGLDGVEALGRAVRFLLSDAGAESGRYEKRRGQRQRSTRLLSRKPSAHSSRLSVSSVHKLLFFVTSRARRAPHYLCYPV